MPRICAKGDASPLYDVLNRYDVYLLPERIVCTRDDAWIISFYDGDLDKERVCTPLYHAVARVVDCDGDFVIQCSVRGSYPGAVFVKASETKTFLEFVEMLEALCPLLC